MRIIDSNQSVWELSQSYPEVVEILAELGFRDILLPGMLQTAGKIMTLRKGAALKKIDWQLIETRFQDKGFSIE